MREIRFRGWDGTRMTDWDDIRQTAGLHWWLFESVEGVTLMQFTGLRDKNGKEIYEGDIVGPLGFNTSISNGVIEYGNGRFYAKPTHGENWLMNAEAAAEHAEIIGNIYETPELLTT